MQNFRTSLATRLKRYVIVTDVQRKLYISGQAMPNLRTTDSRGERTYCWEAADLKPLVAEPLGPPPTEFSPYIHVSTVKDLNDLGRWY